MPHLSIEYSANLTPSVDMAALCRLAAQAISDTSLFEVGAIRVRAFRADVYVVADQLRENAFVDMSLRIGEGRSSSEKKIAGSAIFAAVREFLSPQLATPHFALSFEIREIGRELSWKTNAIHPRLRNK